MSNRKYHYFLPLVEDPAALVAGTGEDKGEGESEFPDGHQLEKRK